MNSPSAYMGPNTATTAFQVIVNGNTNLFCLYYSKHLYKWKLISKYINTISGNINTLSGNKNTISGKKNSIS